MDSVTFKIVWKNYSTKQRNDAFLFMQSRLSVGLSDLSCTWYFYNLYVFCYKGVLCFISSHFLFIPFAVILIFEIVFLDLFFFADMI